MTQVCDIRLDKLGRYFCHFEIHKRYSISFERFVRLVESGQWTEYV
jgi:hypothetical protein